MKLLGIDIQTLPGIDPGFRVDTLDPGTNLVVAPNAGGKSSLLRALRYLIAGPQQGDPVALSLSATFADGNARWTVRRTGSSIAWEKDGEPAEAPPLPSPDQLHCYWFSMEDLLAADSRDQALLLELKRALGGGFDLDAVLDQPEFLVGARHGQSQAKALTDATRKRRGIEADYQSLKDQESLLPQLREKLQNAETAAVKVGELEHALSLLNARDERVQAESGLGAFPENMSKLRGDEIERLQKQETKREEISKERSEQKSVLQKAQDQLLETGLGSGVPDEVEFDALSHDIQEISGKEEQRKAACEKRSSAGREEQRALQQLGGTSTPPKLDPGSISSAEAMALRIQQLIRERDEIQARMPVAAAPDPREQAALSSAAESLRGWLQAGKAAPGSVVWTLGAAAFLVLAAAVAGFLAGEWIVGSLAALALGVIAWMAWSLPRDSSAGFRARYEETGLTPPSAWTAESAREKLQEIEMRCAELREAELRARQISELTERLADIEPKLAEAEMEKAKLAAKLGFDPGITAAGLDRLIRLINDYENAVRGRDDATATISRLDEEMAACRDRVFAFLKTWQVAIPQEIHAASLSPALEGLRSRSRTATNAQREIAAATREIARAETQLTEVDAECAALLEGAGIQEGDTAQLARCCEQFDAWKRQNDLLQNAKVLEAERRRPLEGNSSLLLRVEAGERAELEKELPAAQALADQATELRKQITQIETLREEAGRDAILERASAEEQAALEALEDGLDKALFSDAANFLIDSVRDEYRSGHEPELLQEAREQFSRFTHHAYRLDVDPNHGFRAFDTRHAAMQPLEELSSGTRMQLLLAMRLAWTRKIEQRSVSLPLFLDEALTTSDEERFKQVVISLEALEKDEHRQIFYLSARRNEVALWQDAVGRRPHVIDLAAIRFGNADALPGDYSLPEKETIPAPGSQSPEAYAAQLGIPPVDPSGGDGAAPIFHLLRDDLPLLHHLLQDWRIQTVGQLKSLLRSEAAAHALPDAATRERVAGRCKVVPVWVEAWREGRGKPVDRIALEQSGAISDAFLDRVTELATEQDGNAEVLLAALRNNEVPRFRSASADQLEDWLLSQGYLDPAEPLDSEARERRVLERAAPHAPAEEIQRVFHWLEGSIAKKRTTKEVPKN